MAEVPLAKYIWAGFLSVVFFWPFQNLQKFSLAAKEVFREGVKSLKIVQGALFSEDVVFLTDVVM